MIWREIIKSESTHLQDRSPENLGRLNQVQWTCLIGSICTPCSVCSVWSVLSEQPAVTITRPPAIPIIVSLHHAADFHTFAFRALHSIDAQWHTVGGWGVYVTAVQLIHMTVQIVFVGWCKVYLSDSANCISTWNCTICRMLILHCPKQVHTSSCWRWMNVIIHPGSWIGGAAVSWFQRNFLQT